MKPALASLLITILVAPVSAQLGSGNQCVYRSTVWQEAGYSHRTQISSRAENGCKEIVQSIDGQEERGVDCNCDLIIDGREGDFRAPPTYQATPLLEVCYGPIADPLTYEPQYSIEVVEE